MDQEVGNLEGEGRDMGEGRSTEGLPGLQRGGGEAAQALGNAVKG